METIKSNENLKISIVYQIDDVMREPSAIILHSLLFRGRSFPSTSVILPGCHDNASLNKITKNHSGHKNHINVSEYYEVNNLDQL